MSLKTRRAAAFAVAVTMFFTLVSTDGSGAYARESGPDIAETTPEAAAPVPAAANQVRFVAQEVVQPLAQDNAAPAPDAGEAGSLRELIAAMPIDEEPTGDLRCLAQAIYFEARGEPIEGQLAVGEVVINRAESSAFPDDYCGVVTQRAQFSFVRSGRIPSVATQSPAWERAKAIARIAHQDLWDSPAEDALFFHATRVRPSWARRKIASATIDRHVFYR